MRLALEFIFLLLVFFCLGKACEYKDQQIRQEKLK